jgi:hypothetical protein
LATKVPKFLVFVLHDIVRHLEFAGKREDCENDFTTDSFRSKISKPALHKHSCPVRLDDAPVGGKMIPVRRLKMFCTPQSSSTFILPRGRERLKIRRCRRHILR